MIRHTHTALPLLLDPFCFALKLPFLFLFPLLAGGITTGAISDLLDSRAISCVIMMYLAVPTVRNGMHNIIHNVTCMWWCCSCTIKCDVE